MRLQKVGTFDSPVYVTAPPGDKSRLFVVEQGGKVRVIKGGKTLAKPFLDVSGKISTGNEQGLLSLAFAPDYASSGLFYVYYTDGGGDTQVVEYKRASADVADAGSARTVLTQKQPEPNHNGGLLLFGPDKLLYIGLGDGGGGGDQHGERGNAQSLGTILGKILRIDPRADGSKAYSIPADNPFVGRSGARGEIYSYGLRNPWRFSFDRKTGDLSIGDVGQEEVEEIDFVRARQGTRGELRLAGVRGQRPLHAGRGGGRRDQAGDHREALRRQLLDHRRHRDPRPGAEGLGRALRVRRLLPRRDPDGCPVERPRAQPDGPQAAGRASSRRSARTRAGACTRPRSTVPSTASSSDHPRLARPTRARSR